MNNDLANRLKEVLLNGKWIANTNFKDQITNITWEQVVEKVENLNTIAMLTFHINYYLKGLLNVFEGGNLEIKTNIVLICLKLNQSRIGTVW